MMWTIMKWRGRLSATQSEQRGQREAHLLPVGEHEIVGAAQPVAGDGEDGAWAGQPLREPTEPPRPPSSAGEVQDVRAEASGQLHVVGSRSAALTHRHVEVGRGSCPRR